MGLHSILQMDQASGYLSSAVLPVTALVAEALQEFAKPRYTGR